MGKRSREKGANAERAAATLLRLVHPETERRCSGEECQDDVTGRDLRGAPGLCVQVKETGSPSPLAALDQACACAGPGEIPIAIVRQARRGSSTPFRVVLPIRDWLLLEDIRRRFIDAMPRRYAELESDLALKLEALAQDDPQMKARIG